VIYNQEPTGLNELATALVQFQSEVGAIPKDSSNPFFKSRYAGLPQVVETAGPILAKHGLSISQHIGYEDGHDTLETWLLHTSGQFLVSRMRLHLVKDDPQGQGSAVTYARRYSYMSILSLVADDDDDGNAASQPRQAPRQQSAPQQAPQAGAGNPISEKQAKALYAITKSAGVELKSACMERWGKPEKQLTSKEASVWIDELQNKKTETVMTNAFPGAEMANGEEPF